LKTATSLLPSSLELGELALVGKRTRAFFLIGEQDWRRSPLPFAATETKTYKGEARGTGKTKVTEKKK